MKTETTVLARAMHMLAKDIKSQDSIANAAIQEAGDRLIKQHERILELETLISDLNEISVTRIRNIINKICQKKRA